MPGPWSNCLRSLPGHSQAVLIQDNAAQSTTDGEILQDKMFTSHSVNFEEDEAVETCHHN